MHNTTLSVLFLANMGLTIGIAAGAAVLGLLVGWLVYKAITDKKVGSAEARVKKIINDAETEAEKIRSQGKEDSKRALKEALLEAKEQDLKLRNEFERDTKEKKAEIQRMEQRLTQKEDALDKKTEALEQQKENLLKKEGEIEVLQQKLSSQHELMIQELEKVAQLTREEAKRILTEGQPAVDDYFRFLSSGGCTDPPALAYANNSTGNDAPAVAYSTVYPLTMFLRVVAAQALVLCFM